LPAISIIKVAEDYVNYNGKVFRIEALIRAHPELNLDFNKQVKSGPEFPNITKLGDMFLHTNTTPTQLFIANGTEWNAIDKNVLNFAAYSHEYIKTLIKHVGNGTYNPELLNHVEQKHIEALLGRENEE